MSFLFFLIISHFDIAGEEVIFDRMIAFRQILKSMADNQGIKLSYLPILLKITSLSLLHFPAVNATVNKEVTEVTQHANHHIGVGKLVLH